MPTFYQRPLTWLLVGVFVVLDLLILTGKFSRHLDFFGYVILCQAYLTSEWMFRGRIHWLARLFSTLASISFAALLISCWQSQSFNDQRWSRYLGAIAILFLITSIAFGLTRGVVKAFREMPHERNSSNWRISMMEIFGLTIIVAVGCYVLKMGEYASFLESTAAITWIAGSILIGVILAIADRPTRRLPAGLFFMLGGCFLLFMEVFARPHTYMISTMGVIGACLFIRAFEPTLDEQPAESIEE